MSVSATHNRTITYRVSSIPLSLLQSKPVQYQTYTKANWSSPYLMNVTNAGHPALDAVQSKGISLMNDKFFVIYFASYGLLVIKPNQGKSSYDHCLNNLSRGSGQAVNQLIQC